MKYFSTKNKNTQVSFKEAVMKGLPDDNGLFMPNEIEVFSADFINNLKDLSFEEIAFSITKPFVGTEVPTSELTRICGETVNFPAPLVNVMDNSTFSLELWHGPSLAFKDFGARFMARVMGYFNIEENKPLNILVATSGDTGGAVAFGFLDVPGINVTILYPSGKVSNLQEKQLTTLGSNIKALEVNGTFDDCQNLVKTAFLDTDLNSSLRLSSANSINIARLIPQIFYYFESFKQLDNTDNVVYSVPSGNFGNLTAGLIGKKMGLPIEHFVAATNINDVVPEYLHSGIYSPRPSVATISNAMDVGNPSNFDRILNLYGSTWNAVIEDISGFGFTDEESQNAMIRIYQESSYVSEPHGAIGLLGLDAYRVINGPCTGVFLETAHPAKFIDEVQNTLEIDINIPDRLKVLENREKKSEIMDTEYKSFKEWILANLN
jgi:threonine synthase